MRIRLHWLLLGTVVFTIVSWVGAMWALERANRRAYVRDTEVLTAAGLVMNWDDLAAEVTPADPKAVAAWEAWCALGHHAEEDAACTAWLRHGHGGPPDSAAAWVERHRAAVAPILPVLRSGDLRWGLSSRLHIWLAGPRDWQQLMAGPADLLYGRTLAAWLRWQALTADDPEPWLTDLDRLVAAGDPALIPLDAIVQVAIAALRDEARWLAVVRCGQQLDSEHPWFAAPALSLAQAWTGERLYGSTVAEEVWFADYSQVRASMTWGTPGRSAWRAWVDQVLGAINPTSHWQWATLPAGASHVRFTIANEERRLRGEPALPEASGLGGAGNFLAAISLPHLLETNLSAAEHSLRARIVRIAARLVLDHRAGHALPVDAEALSQRLGAAILAADAASPPLLFTRTADGGFSLAGDLSQPAGVLGMLRRDQRLDVPMSNLTP